MLTGVLLLRARVAGDASSQCRKGCTMKISSTKQSSHNPLPLFAPTSPLQQCNSRSRFCSGCDQGACQGNWLWRERWMQPAVSTVTAAENASSFLARVMNLQGSVVQGLLVAVLVALIDVMLWAPNLKLPPDPLALPIVVSLSIPLYRSLTFWFTSWRLNSGSKINIQKEDVQFRTTRIHHHFWVEVGQVQLTWGSLQQVGDDLNRRNLAPEMSRKHGEVRWIVLVGNGAAHWWCPRPRLPGTFSTHKEKSARPPTTVVFDIFTGKGPDMVFTVYGEHWCCMRRIVTMPFFINLQSSSAVPALRGGWQDKALRAHWL